MRFRIFLIVLFLIIGVVALYMGLNINLKCPEATLEDNLAAGLPLAIFGAYSLVTSFFLWNRPQIGSTLAVLAFFIAIVFAVIAYFNLPIAIIKTSCVDL